MSENEVLIKKYSNRRLYNADEKKYVNLEDIADIIREGHNIKVIDTSSNDDITKQILAQIIMEEEKNRKDVLPMELFYKIIRSNQDFVREFFDNYLNYTLDSYLRYRESMEEKLKEIQDMNNLPREMGEVFMKSLRVMSGLNPFMPPEEKK